MQEQTPHPNLYPFAWDDRPFDLLKLGCTNSGGSGARWYWATCRKDHIAEVLLDCENFCPLQAKSGLFGPNVEKRIRRCAPRACRPLGFKENPRQNRKNLSGKNSRSAKILVKFQFRTHEIRCEKCIATNFGPFWATFPEERGWAKFHQTIFTANPPCDCTKKIPAEVLLTLIEFFRGPPRDGRQLYLTFPSAPGPLFKASKAPFLALRDATPSGAPRQAPLETLFWWEFGFALITVRIGRVNATRRFGVAHCSHVHLGTTAPKTPAELKCGKSRVLDRG